MSSPATLASAPSTITAIGSVDSDNCDAPPAAPRSGCEEGAGAPDAGAPRPPPPDGARVRAHCVRCGRSDAGATAAPPRAPRIPRPPRPRERPRERPRPRPPGSAVRIPSTLYAIGSEMFARVAIGCRVIRPGGGADVVRADCASRGSNSPGHPPGGLGCCATPRSAARSCRMGAGAPVLAGGARGTGRRWGAPGGDGPRGGGAAALGDAPIAIEGELRRNGATLS